MNEKLKKISVFFVLFLAIFFIQNVVYADSMVTVPIVGNYNQISAREVLDIVNQERQSNGQQPLKWDADLEAAAMQRAVEVSGYFSHTRPSGGLCWEALDDLGISKNYGATGENIAYGLTNATSVMNVWMNSSGHRANILSVNYNAIGVARCGNSWVQMFGYKTSTINETPSRFMGSKSYNVKVKDGVFYFNLESITFDFGEVSNDLLSEIDTNGQLRAYVTTSDKNLVSEDSLYYAIDKNALTFTTSNSNILQVSGKKVTANDVGNATLTFKYGSLSADVKCTVNPPNMADILFDAKYYADKYPDLKSTFGYDAGALRNHYENYGKAEGRQASPVFDAKYYLDNNSDLKNAYNNNYVEAFNHFVAFGIAEYRKSSPEYWGDFYIKNNKDLNGFSNYRLIMHYLSFGRGEGRKANVNSGTASTPTSVPVQTAPSANLDGVIFNAKFYADVNQDLYSAYGYNEEALRLHWNTFGMKEGRMASPAFDVKYYVEHNSDLKQAYNVDYVSAIEHFKAFGAKEGRRSSRVFDVKYYLNNNTDLKNTYGSNYASAFEHFAVYGWGELRKTASDFDLSVYRNSNGGDLVKAFANNWNKYYVHYIIFGMNENRKCI